jgi:hypothetical protein
MTCYKAHAMKPKGSRGGLAALGDRELNGKSRAAPNFALASFGGASPPTQIMGAEGEQTSILAKTERQPPNIIWR